MTMNRILRAVAEVYGVREATILGRKRYKHVARPRQVAMWLIREKLRLSYPDIGRYFCKDHSSVMAACKRIDLLLPQDSELKDRIEKIEAALIPAGENPPAKQKRERIMRMLRAALDNAEGLFRSLELEDAALTHAALVQHAGEGAR